MFSKDNLNEEGKTSHVGPTKPITELYFVPRFCTDKEAHNENRYFNALQPKTSKLPKPPIVKEAKTAHFIVNEENAKSSLTFFEKVTCRA